MLRNEIKAQLRNLNHASIFVLIYFLLSTESGVTSEERRLILEEHNYLRQTVATGHVPGQPAAQNMQEMQWDDELAARAQQWANECTFQHDPSRYVGKFKHRRCRRDTANPAEGFSFIDGRSTEIKHFIVIHVFSHRRSLTMMMLREPN